MNGIILKSGKRVLLNLFYPFNTIPSKWTRANLNNFRAMYMKMVQVSSGSIDIITKIVYLRKDMIIVGLDNMIKIFSFTRPPSQIKVIETGK